MKNMIAFFDSDCLHCNRFINFVMRIDQNGRVKFSKINGELYQRVISNSAKKVDSIIYLKNDKEYLYSDAIVRILSDANPFFRLLLIQNLLPKYFREKIYTFFASKRKKVEYCPLPKKEFRDRFM
ncbi:thiol-disulfide oxidoreductase DCC family protein [Peribacillus sp. NPDC097295]|uniref:thiol-disulfide oxidoreductase DCC family protein n=1 Tax=Peribacillus sp. NPDC097295 TaxID=3364402 RepID=UPI0038199D73